MSLYDFGQLTKKKHFAKTAIQLAYNNRYKCYQEEINNHVKVNVALLTYMIDTTSTKFSIKLFRTKASKICQQKRP